MFSLILSLLLACSSLSVVSAAGIQAAAIEQFKFPTFSEMIQQMREQLQDAISQLQVLVTKKSIPQAQIEQASAEIVNLGEHLKTLAQIEKNGPEPILKNNASRAVALITMAMVIGTSMTDNEALRSEIVETFQPMIERIANGNKTVLLESTLLPLLDQSIVQSPALIDLLKKMRAIFIKHKQSTKELDQAIAELTTK